MRITTVLSEAQNGQAHANLARAFHLPPTKVEVAVEAMLDALIPDIGTRMRSRRSLAGMVELLGKNAYEHVLESPMQLGATRTQVLGTEALNVIAGRNESKRLARQAAAVAGVSEMIAEYLLPVVAAMLVGALAKLGRPGLEEIMRRAGGGPDPLSSWDEANRELLQLPQVAGGGGFTGSTGGTVSVASSAAATSHYVELAEDIRRAGRASGASDPAEAVRRLLASILRVPLGPLAWIRRVGAWGTGALNAALARWRR